MGQARMGCSSQGDNLERPLNAGRRVFLGNLRLVGTQAFGVHSVDRERSVMDAGCTASHEGLAVAHGFPEPIFGSLLHGLGFLDDGLGFQHGLGHL